MASSRDDIRARLLATFSVEADEHLQALTASLLALDRGLPDAEARQALEATFREVHTLKGAARSVGLVDVEAVSQACESVLSRLTRGQLTLSRPLLRCLEEATDGVARLLAGGAAPGLGRALIERLEQAAAQGNDAAPVALPPAPIEDVSASARGAAGSPAESVRVATARLDGLIVEAENLLGLKLAAGERVSQARALLGALEGQGPSPRASARDLLAQLARDERAARVAIEALQGQLRQLRMMPAASVLDIFPRMVRDLAEQQGKEIEWSVTGADLEVDRRVLQLIKEPLIHLVRNAVDHGIEAPAARVEAGKAPRGRVAMAIAGHEGHRIEVTVEDDGRGIDLAQVRAAAVRARLLSSEQAQTLTDDEALALVYRSGLSTSPIVTAISGHGLGLAIVKERVEQMGGAVRIGRSGWGGTVIRMILPATVVTFSGLLVQVGGQPFLLPIEAVERVLRLDPGDVKSVEGRDAIGWNGTALSVASLGAVLGVPEPEGQAERGSKQPGVVVRAGEEQAAFLVDQIVGVTEVLVKELRPPLVRVRNVAGAGLLGTGRLALILRPADLLRSMRVSGRPAGPAREARKDEREIAVLVVDDSITTRTMEKNLLEAAGYRVRVAVDGLEAWTILKSEPIDVVVSDVDMPRMDGFELTARIRADQRLGELPVILVTALESREDKERGVQVGANAYVVKSSFEQSNLLGIIQRLA